MQRLLGKAFRFYRFYYSIFSVLYLLPVLYLQFTIESPAIWREKVVAEFVGILMGITGLAIMLVCIRKYFFDLSGIKAFAKSKSSSAVLKTDGLHNIMRHPLYFGTLLFIWSFFLLFPLLSNLTACILITIYTIVGIRIEERKLIVEFGELYTEYAGKVPMLIPRYFIIREKLRQRFSVTAR